MAKKYWEKNLVGVCDVCGNQSFNCKKRFEVGVNMLGKEMPKQKDDKLLVSLCNNCFINIMG